MTIEELSAWPVMIYDTVYSDQRYVAVNQLPRQRS